MVGRLDQVERQIADDEVRAGRGNRPPVGQERGAADDDAGKLRPRRATVGAAQQPRRQGRHEHHEHRESQPRGHVPAILAEVAGVWKTQSLQSWDLPDTGLRYPSLRNPELKTGCMLPFILRRPAGDPVLVYDSPHSGRFYPDDFHTRATQAELRLAEDAYLDDLLGPAVARDVAVLDATWPRVYVDLDCAEDDLDVSLLADEWLAPVKPTEKTLQGFGLVRRLAAPAVEIYDRLLTAAEVETRLATVYRPYHAALERLLEEVRAARGFAWLVDWHAMRSVGAPTTPDGRGRRRPDFVVANLDGASAGAELTDRAVDTLRGMGYDVGFNAPFNGGQILRRHARPAAGVHALQIKVNRALYLDEGTVTPNEGMAVVRRDIDYLTAVLVEAALART